MLYSEIILEKVPEGKYAVVWYNNMHKYKPFTQDYFINYVLKNLETNESKVVSINIKEASVISLGSIFNHRQLSRERLGEIYTTILNIPKHNKYFKVNRQDISLYKNEQYFGLQEKIILDDSKRYNLLQRSQEQTLLEYTDIEENNILIPSYVIAQYYYFRSSSMSRQVMAKFISNKDALKGLYKSYSRDKDGNASIVLKPNARGRDGAEIFRFAVQKYSHEMFHRIYKDLGKSYKEIEAKFKKHDYPMDHKIATLSAFFPFYGMSYFKYRGVELSDGRILVLEILAEDSHYPFESLTVYRQSKRFNNQTVQLGKVFNTLNTNINNYMNTKTPNNGFVPVDVYTEQKIDGRLDLDDKEINYAVLETDEESESSNEIVDVDYDTDLSTNEAESSGELDTVQANIENDNVDKPDGWDEKERPGLEAFLIMLQTAQKKSIEKNQSFDYFVDDELMLPQKSEHDKSRKQWLKGLMIGSKTPRAYSCAHIQYNGKYICVFDVERDKRVEGLSLLIVQMIDNTQVGQDIINDILVDFVKEKGSWLKKVDTSSFKYKNIYHPQKISEESIKSWANRLINTLNKF